MSSAAADLAASRKRAEAQESDLRRAAGRLRDQAEQALGAGREDLGRDALIHRAEMIAHANDLAAEQAALRAEEERLAEAARRLETRFEALRYRKEALKAAYTAAGAATVGEPVRASDDAADVVAAARRAEDQAAALVARAEAISQQIDAGGPQSPPSLDFYRIQEQLDALTRDAGVEEELARIRAQVRPRATKRPPGKDSGKA